MVSRFYPFSKEEVMKNKAVLNFYRYQLMNNEFIDYIHNNAVEAGIIDKFEDYLYSSAIDYLDIKGKIEFIKIEAKVY